MTETLKERARTLGLHGLVAHWGEVAEHDWVAALIAWEEDERRSRGLKRRLSDARLGQFKPLADFDWSWPQTLRPHAAIEDPDGPRLHRRGGQCRPASDPNGVGKSTTRRQSSPTVRYSKAIPCRFVTAAAHARRTRRHRQRQHCCSASLALLCPTSSFWSSMRSDISPTLKRHADLLFHIVSSRSRQHSTIITTNRPFAEWSEAFPNAACLVALVDRLVHNAEIVPIDGDSWRRKEAEERQRARSAERQRRNAKERRRAAKTSA